MVVPKGGARPNTGGAREGAGRKPGVPNRKSAEDIATAAAGGIMPKFALLTVMRHHLSTYEQLMTEEPKRPSMNAGKPKDRWFREITDWRKEVAACLDNIRVAARDAAPYFHPRLSAVKVEPSLEDIRQIDLKTLTDEQLEILLHRVGVALGITTDIAGGDDSGGEIATVDGHGPYRTAADVAADGGRHAGCVQGVGRGSRVDCISRRRRP